MNKNYGIYNNCIVQSKSTGGWGNGAVTYLNKVANAPTNGVSISSFTFEDGSSAVTTGKCGSWTNYGAAGGGGYGGCGGYGNGTSGGGGGGGYGANGGNSCDGFSGGGGGYGGKGADGYNGNNYLTNCSGGGGGYGIANYGAGGGGTAINGNNGMHGCCIIQYWQKELVL
jgi:hypothetical protein